MLLDQITLKDFRCFREKQTARLAPLTLLVGENSTGKTSFLAMIRALWDVAYQHRVPDFKEDPYDLGSFDEIAHYRGGRGGRADTFEAGFDSTRKTKNRAGVTKEAEGYHFEVTFGKNGTVPVPVRRRISDKHAWTEEYDPQRQRDKFWRLKFGTSNGAWKLKRSAGRLPFVEDHDRMLSFFIFSRFLFRAIENPEKGLESIAPEGSKSPTSKDWESIERLSLTLRRVGFVGSRQLQLPYASAPVRSKPRRTYDPARPVRDPEGDYTPMYLANLHFQNKKQWETLRSALVKFGQTAGLFDEISVNPLGSDSGPFQVQIRKFGGRRKGPQRNLIDVATESARCCR